MSYTLTIDLHGHTKDSAKALLYKTLKTLPPDVHELEVIHGYHQGNSLQTMVRKFSHPKVERKILGLNQGSTILVIKRNPK